MDNIDKLYGDVFTGIKILWKMFKQKLSVKLSRSHYCELLSIENENKRSFKKRKYKFKLVG